MTDTMAEIQEWTCKQSDTGVWGCACVIEVKYQEDLENTAQQGCNDYIFFNHDFVLFFGLLQTTTNLKNLFNLFVYKQVTTKKNMFIWLILSLASCKKKQ